MDVIVNNNNKISFRTKLEKYIIKGENAIIDRVILMLLSEQYNCINLK